MNFFKKLFSPPALNAGKFHDFSVKCKRCGEVIHGQVNVYNDPSAEYDEKGTPYYICRKVLIGSGRCYQQVEVVIKFDEKRNVLDRQITGGEFI